MQRTIECGLLLICLALTSCSEEVEVDRTLEYIRSADRIILDPDEPTERVLKGDSVRAFLDPFDRDTFRPGPYSVRIETDCRAGALGVGRALYPFSLCRLSGRRVMTVDLDTGFVRLVGG